MPIGKVWIYRLPFVCLFFVRLLIFSPRIKLTASNFARRFIGVSGRESPIFVNFPSPEAQNRTNRRARHHHDVHNNYFLAPEHTTTRRMDVRSACVDILQSRRLGWVFLTFYKLVFVNCLYYICCMRQIASVRHFLIFKYTVSKDVLYCMKINKPIWLQKNQTDFY